MEAQQVDYEGRLAAQLAQFQEQLNALQEKYDHDMAEQAIKMQREELEALTNAQKTASKAQVKQETAALNAEIARQRDDLELQITAHVVRYNTDMAAQHKAFERDLYGQKRAFEAKMIAHTSAFEAELAALQRSGQVDRDNALLRRTPKKSPRNTSKPWNLIVEEYHELRCRVAAVWNQTTPLPRSILDALGAFQTLRVDIRRLWASKSSSSSPLTLSSSLPTSRPPWALHEGVKMTLDANYNALTTTLDAARHQLHDRHEVAHGDRERQIRIPVDDSSSFDMVERKLQEGKDFKMAHAATVASLTREAKIAPKISTGTAPWSSSPLDMAATKRACALQLEDLHVEQSRKVADLEQTMASQVDALATELTKLKEQEEYDATMLARYMERD
ncbi:hypothetical protein LEN26_008545 [Aphanomyces euteiches]|nr:hypothetical protein AeMF1_002632 [Aphanomyces euteiches]KAH9130413.1 hypothetical protein LEN26_008545 [Aphanomyces euteiches]KAH9190232.1 hypothetical protein AeNC1_007790 [Aphanomyces euteiches]